MLPYIEFSFLEMKYNNNKNLIGGIYRVPNTNIDCFLEKLNSIVEPLKSSYKMVLLGDYNINLLKNEKYKNSFELSLQLNYLIPRAETVQLFEPGFKSDRASYNWQNQKQVTRVR